MTNTNTEWESKIKEIVSLARKQNWKNGGVHEYDTDEIEELLSEVFRTEKEKSYQEGRLDVLKDFDTVCCADAFMGFSDSEWSAIKRFFKLNKELSRWDKSVTPTNTV